MYDNVDNPDVVQGWLPPSVASGGGCFVMTSQASGENFRRAGLAVVGSPIELDALGTSISWHSYGKQCSNP